MARAVSEAEVDRGILICGSGMGMCIVANKFDGVRAAPCHDDLTAEMSRLHNDSNVLSIGERLVPAEDLEPILKVWLETPFEGGRHQRRIDEIDAV